MAFSIRLILCWLVIIATLKDITCQSLVPPYFDIAKGKKIAATATCGYDLPDDETKELFCKLAGVPGKFGIQGQYCDHCDRSSIDSDHKIENANDGSERWWQSPPLSRGLEYSAINVTVDLGQMYHVAYVIIKAANSPRPGIWSLERSSDGGKTFTPWHHFANSPSDCRSFFGMSPLVPLVRDNTVLCSTGYSQIPPFENGEIHISLVNDRPGSKNFSFSPELQEWTSATHVRLRLMRIKTLLGDLMPLSPRDPTVTRRYYYSIKDISIGGRCMCNGFADECKPSPSQPDSFICDCQHNSAGTRCEQCKDGFVQKKWQPRRGDNTFVCEKCNCHSHSDQCQFNEEVSKRKLSLDMNGNYEGGGVCLGCKDNTYGINCEKCKPSFYRPEGVPITSKDACQPCNCDRSFSTGTCTDGSGQCECKQNYRGRYCDRCNAGYFGFPDCIECQCNKHGSEEGICQADEFGECSCKPGFGGKLCDQCLPGFFGFPSCEPCKCLVDFGASDNTCDSKSGQCSCLTGFTGRICDRCIPGHFGFPRCSKCDCDSTKTTDYICSQGSGRCRCLENYSGDRCDSCAPGYHNYPLCLSCDCSGVGSLSPNCDSSLGRCGCKPNFTGAKCDQCATGYFGYPNCERCKCDSTGSLSPSCRASDGQCPCDTPFSGRSCNRCQLGHYGFPNCRKCNCNPAGLVSTPNNNADCSLSNDGQCTCKENVNGLSCSECKMGYYNLQSSNPDGCKDCACYRPGTQSGMLKCDSVKGQCVCKKNVQSRQCTQCEDGYYNLKEVNFFGCQGCDCNIAGSLSGVCQKSNGQCQCKPNIEGRKCDRPSSGYFFPNLHQLTVEAEYGKQRNGQPVTTSYKSSDFPGFSWKGYTMFTEFQNQVILSVDVPKQSRYQMIIHYVLNQVTPVTTTIAMYPEGFSDGGKLTASTSLPTTQAVGNFTSASAVVTSNGQPVFFSLRKGKYNIAIEAPNSALLVDKIILIPQEYAAASAVVKTVVNQCEVKSSAKLCNQLAYPRLNLDGVVHFEAEDADNRGTLVLFDDAEVLRMHDYSAMASLTPRNVQLNIRFAPETSGPYVLVVQYYHESPIVKFLDVYMRTYDRSQRGKVYLYQCKYKFGCRQPALDSDGGVKVYNVKSGDSMLITLVSRLGATVGIDSVTAIPLKDWSPDMVSPAHLCTTYNNKCIKSNFDSPKNAHYINVGTLNDGTTSPRPADVIDPSATLLYINDKSSAKIPFNNIPAGQYYAIFHYYQPKNILSSATGSVDSKPNMAMQLPFKYCPSTSGCRLQALRASSGDGVFSHDGSNYVLNVQSAKDVWIDYVLLVPAAVYDAKLLAPLSTSLANDFRTACLDSTFTVNNNQSFCHDGAFTITTDFNSGTLACNCDKDGSDSSKCEAFGGQCQCKPLIIGRRCNQCQPGYYGFPNCKQCACSNCDEVTGKCSCGVGVQGDECNECKKGYFGFDETLTCQKCDCSLYGSLNNTNGCNNKDGQCECLPRFEGRSCNQCQTGYYSYPSCEACDCDINGVTDSVCGQSDGKCNCKENVTGDDCSLCKLGFYKNAAQSCSRCNCSGQSMICSLGNDDKEQCICPIAYHGTACEMCSSGYTRQSDGTCAPCDCNGRSDGCHPETGVCYNCKSNSMGDQCETCMPGYHGNPCRMCECPFASLVGNHADTCSSDVNNTIQCVCKEGYAGANCSVCSGGYYGMPHTENGTCQRCSCNDNIDTTLEGNCDRQTGACLKCQNDTHGKSCESCRPGYHGDATNAKNCTDCMCNACGAADFQCNTADGQCPCKANVIGGQCSQCKENHWNFKSCLGCEDCECGAASLKKQCNMTTGQCQCPEGVIGRKCDWCRQGYTNYSANGCQKCNCADGDLCDILTGRCDCDAKTEKCTFCPPGYILEGKKCVICDQCVQNLLKRTAVLTTNVTSQLEIIKRRIVGSVSNDLLSKANKSIERIKKLSSDNMRANKAIEKSLGFGSYSKHPGSLGYYPTSVFEKCMFMAVDEKPFMEFNGSLVPVNSNDTLPPEGRINRRRRDTTGNSSQVCPASLAYLLGSATTTQQKLNGDSDDLAKITTNLSNSSSNLKERAYNILDALKVMSNQSRDAMSKLNATLNDLAKNSTSSNASISMALAALKEIRSRNFTDAAAISDSMYIAAKEAKVTSSNALSMAKNLSSSFMNVNNQYKDSVDAVLAMIEKETKLAMMKSQNATTLNKASEAYNVQALVQKATELSEKHNTTIGHATNLFESSQKQLNAAVELLLQLTSNSSDLANLMQQLRDHVRDLAMGNSGMNASVAVTEDHAAALQRQADILEGLIKDTKEFADAAVRAAMVYSDIVNAVKEALEMATIARNVSETSHAQAVAAVSSAAKSKDDSENVAVKVDKLSNTVQDDVTMPTAKSLIDFDRLLSLRKQVRDRLEKVRSRFASFNNEVETGTKADPLKMAADKANSRADDIRAKAEAIMSDVSAKKDAIDDLKTFIGDVNKQIAMSAANVTTVEDKIPEVRTVIESLNQRKENLAAFIKANLTVLLDGVKYKIAHARSLANLSPLVMNFSPITSISVDLPQSMIGPMLKSHLEMYTKTTSFNGLLLFLGDGNNDLLALDLLDGKVRLHVKEGSKNLTTITNPLVISNDKWHKIVATRFSGNLSLSVQSEDDLSAGITPTIESFVAPFDTLSVLSFNSSDDVFVGGSVSASTVIPPAVDSSQFVGCMNGLSLGEETVGLWNWKTSSELAACEQREAFTSPSNEYRLGGSGFLRFSTADRSENIMRRVKLSFKTLQPNGLLFVGYDSLASSPGNFVAVELIEGKLVLRYSQDGINIQTISPDLILNDGKLHTVSKTRTKFKVDEYSQTFARVSSGFDADTVLVGGVPYSGYLPHMNISRVPFTGCISNLALYQQYVPRNLEDSKDYEESCVGYGSATISLPSNQSYIGIEACSLNPNSSLSLSFQSSQPNALLLFGNDSIMPSSLLLTLEDGIVMLGGQIADEIVLIRSRQRFDDGQWHVVIIRLQGDQLFLVVDDDSSSITIQKDNPSNQQIILTDVMYIGNVPSDKLPQMSDRKTGFVGNFRFLTCNNQMLDFMNFKEKNEVLFSSSSSPVMTIEPQAEMMPATISPPFAMTTGELVTDALTTIGSVVTTATVMTTEPATTEQQTTKATTTEQQTTTTEQQTTTSEPTTTEQQTTTTEATTTMQPTTQPPTTTPIMTTKVTATTVIPTTSPASCVLPPDFSGTQGYGFGSVPLSYIEFPINIKGIGTKGEYIFYFQSLHEDGVLLAALTKSLLYDYEMVFLSQGSVVYMFGSGQGPLTLKSPEKYNDGKWHKVKVTRASKVGSLTIDDKFISEGSSPGSSTGINSYYAVQFGGTSVPASVAKIPEKSRVALKGCIRDISAMANPFPAVNKQEGVTNCGQAGIIDGLFVGKNGGSAEYGTKFYVGMTRTFTMSIRPRSLNGTLLFATGSGDYIRLDLVDGSLVAKVQNGGGVITTTFTPPTNNQLCDGFFHDVTLRKEGFVVKLTVDGFPTVEVTGPKSSRSAETNSPLYIGGDPTSSSPASFHGCISNVTVNGAKITYTKYNGSAMKGCEDFGP